MATTVQNVIIPQVPPGTLIPPVVERTKLAAKPEKKLIRRTDRDDSQIVRRSFQGAFLLLNAWLGTIFYFWVRQFEPDGAPTSLQRPAGVEGWLPIAGLMNLRYFLLSHHVPALHPAPDPRSRSQTRRSPLRRNVRESSFFRRNWPISTAI